MLRAEFIIFIYMCEFCFQAETAQSQACEQFETMSAQAKEELMDFKTRRIHALRKR